MQADKIRSGHVRLLYLIIFSPVTRLEDGPSLQQRFQRQIDKDDWDEASQILFAGGSDFRKPNDHQGTVDWNLVLGQMGLAKGLVGLTG